MPEPLTQLHVISHVHWDREWYRGFDGYRGRLVELVETVCAGLENDTWQSFHLDGQTVVLEDVLEIRPDLEPRLVALVATGRLTVGPWHVLADNQLVSAENLLRNLFRARRWGRRIGRLSRVGYSPDAFGHPADLPRILRGFGMDTALVWRGAPPQSARFTWVSPDGSEVFAVNQGYHQTEVLWHEGGSSDALREFAESEAARLPDGPHLLLNGGDHLVPRPPRDRAAQARAAGIRLIESSLEPFFEAAQSSAAAAALPVIEGELRHRGDRLTFLLPGTLSARSYVKLANEHAQSLLERFAEPRLARQRQVPDSGSHASLAGLLDHAWDLVIKNSPHDSICGCSIDEVHRATTVRAERAVETGELLVQRLLLEDGLDTRRYGDPPAERIAVVVYSGHGHELTGPVVVEVATAPGVQIDRLLADDGTEVEFEVESTRTEMIFEADLDLLPDSRECAVHRVAFTANAVPAFGWRVYAATLVPAPAEPPTLDAADMTTRRIESGRFVIEVNDDASLRVTDRETGLIHEGVGLLRSTGDRGDSYNYDPPLNDLDVVPRVDSVTVFRSTIVIAATLRLPVALNSDRDSRSASTVDAPVSITIEHSPGDDVLRWTVTVDNTADDHRLGFDVPVDASATTWTADQHWSSITRPIGAAIREMPDAPALEAEYAVAPVHSWASVGRGDSAMALLTRGLPEVQATTSAAASTLSVTILRAVGWLSRFDLRTRTTGAGPMMAVPEAQCRGPITVSLGVVFGRGAESGSLELARKAAEHRVPLAAHALRPGTPTPGVFDRGSAPIVSGALVSAWKPTEDGEPTSTALRIWNPADRAVTATVELPAGVTRLWRARLDETPIGNAPIPVTPGVAVLVELGPFATETLLLR